MPEKLLNTREVSEYLGISEQELRKLVDRGEIPAYRLGGTILRFKKEQIDKIKARGVPKIIKLEEEATAPIENSLLEHWKDFLYFNDFYILSLFVTIILLIIIFFY